MPAEIIDHDAFDGESFDFWSKVACWTPEEAARLSLSLEPVTLAPSVLFESGQQDSILYRQRELLILRAIEAGQLTSPLSPLAFIEWAKRYDVSIPEGLRQAIIENDSKGRRACADDNCHPKITASMQKMLFAMAINGYGWNPTDRRSPTVSEIVSDLHNVGISLSPNTVRTRLTEAYERYGRASVDEIRPA